MKVGLGTSVPRLPSSGYLWVVISVLLTLGLLSTLIDLTGTSAKETKYALDMQQRVIIDAETGAVSGADRPAKLIVKEEDVPAAEDDFEVGEESDVGESPVTQAPAEPEDVAKAPAKPSPIVDPSIAGTIAEDSAGETVLEDNAPELATAPMMADIPKVARTKDSLVLAPAPEVSEITPEGALPKRGEGENVTPAMIYSRNYTRNDEIATLHFVVVGLGFGSDTLALAQELPPEVSFAFSPYGESLTAQIESSRNAGHEVWVQLPVQTERYPQDDPGPLGLISTLGPDVFEARLLNILLSMPGAVGVVFPADETLSSSAKIFSEVLKKLNDRGLIALSTHPKRMVKQLTTDGDIRKMLAKADVLLDDVPNEAVIKSKLAGLMDETKKRRQMVVVMHARPQTMILVKNWLARTKYEGVQLAPLSAKLLRPPKMLTPEDVEEAKPEGGGHGAPVEGAAEAKPAEGGHGGGH